MIALVELIAGAGIANDFKYAARVTSNGTGAAGDRARYTMQRLLLIILGWAAFALACLGAVLPLLPTTPFLLVAAWCFSRSSPRFHRWLLYNSWFGGYLRHWQEHRGLPSGAKPKALVFIILTFALSLWLVNLWWVRILLLVILTGLLFFMWRLPVIDAEQQKTP